MILDRIGRIFGTGRLNSLLLEMFAIFLGITASFALDEWREQRQKVETFEHYLEAIYYDAARERASTRRSIYINNQVIGALNALLSDSVASLPERELSMLMSEVVANLPASRPRNDGGYQAMLAADLALPLDDTMQQINDLYALREQFLGFLAIIVARQDVTLLGTLNQRGAFLRAPVYTWNEAEDSVVSIPRQDLPMYAGINRLLSDGIDTEPPGTWAERARLALQDPGTRRTLREQLESLASANDLTVAIMGINENIQAVVRERLPDLTLPVRTLGLLGSATEGGWLVPRAIALTPEPGQGNWWSAEMTLTDGMGKFIANENYGTSWGVDYAWDVMDPLADQTHYLGDPEPVFPHGTGALDGQNIPIRAGHYRVRFNIRTFEYAFETITGGG